MSHLSERALSVCFISCVVKIWNIKCTAFEKEYYLLSKNTSVPLVDFTQLQTRIHLFHFKGSRYRKMYISVSGYKSRCQSQLLLSVYVLWKMKWLPEQITTTYNDGTHFYRAVKSSLCLTAGHILNTLTVIMRGPAGEATIFDIHQGHTDSRLHRFDLSESTSLFLTLLFSFDSHGCYNHILYNRTKKFCIQVTLSRISFIKLTTLLTCLLCYRCIITTSPSDIFHIVTHHQSLMFRVFQQLFCYELSCLLTVCDFVLFPDYWQPLVNLVLSAVGVMCRWGEWKWKRQWYWEQEIKIFQWRKSRVVSLTQTISCLMSALHYALLKLLPAEKWSLCLRCHGFSSWMMAEHQYKMVKLVKSPCCLIQPDMLDFHLFSPIKLYCNLTKPERHYTELMLVSY